MLSKTSATILKAALNEKKQQALALDAKFDFTPDSESLRKLRTDTAYQEGRYLGAKKLGDKASITAEYKKWMTLKKSLKIKEKEYDNWLNLDFDEHEAAIEAIESEIREIENDLGPYKVRELIEEVA